MAHCGVPYKLYSAPFHLHQCHQNRSPAHISSSFLSCESFPKFKKELFSSILKLKKLKFPQSRSATVISASQVNFFKVLQTVWKVGKDGINAGSNLVPTSIPRPVARVSVSAVLLIVSLFLIKSFLSVAFFVLGTMGLVYFIFITLNKDDSPKSGGANTRTTPNENDSLEEARRIMEKYK